MALTCFGSLLDCCSRPIRLVLHDDGTLTADDVGRLKEQLRNAVIFSRSESDELSSRLLTAYPNCRNFRAENVMALKLLDLAMFNEPEIAYCDSDIFFFRPFQGLFEFPDVETSALFMQDTRHAYSLRPWHLCGRDRVKIVGKLNAGLMFVKKEIVDLDFIEWLLANERLKPQFRRKPCWAEQTCWAALAYRTKCRFWDSDQVAVITHNFLGENQLVAGHFTSPVRHLMARIPDRVVSDEPIVTIRTVACKPLMPLTLAGERLADRLLRAWKRCSMQCES